MSQKIIRLIALFLVLTACQPQQRTLKPVLESHLEKPQEISLLDQERERHERLREISLKDIPKDFAVRHYDISVTLSEDKAEIIGKTEIQLKRLNPGNVSLVLDFGSTLVLKEVLLEGADVTEKIQRQDDKLEVPLAGLIKDVFRVTVSYEVNDPTKAVFIVKDGGKVVEYATMTEPLDSRFWFPSIDHPLIKSENGSDVSITVPNHWKALSNGSLESKTTVLDKTTYHWKHRFPIPTYLISILAGPLEVVKPTKVTAAPIEYWVPQDGVTYAEKGFALTPEMFEFFSETLVPFPFEKYFVGVGKGFSGAMEHTTSTSFSFSMYTPEQGFDASVAAHELAHHWFGDLVTCSTWTDLWLNESFASLFDVLFWEKWSGVEHRVERMAGYRERYMDGEPEGKNGNLGPIYNLSTDPNAQFNRLSYEKGALVLDVLRLQLGEKVFYKALKNYLTKFAYKNATTVDFKKVMEETSGQDLTMFFSQWIYGSGYPELLYSWSWDPSSDDLSVEIEQTQTADKVAVFDFLTDIQYAYLDNNNILLWEKARVRIGPDRKSVIRLNSPFKPQIVLLDPEHRVLSIKKAVKLEPEWRLMVDQGPIYLSRIEAIQGLGKDFSAVDVEKVLAKEKSAPVMAAALSALSHSDLVIADKIARPYLKHKEKVIRTAVINVFGDLKNKSAVPEIIDLFLNDSNHVVAMVAANNLGRIGDIRAVEPLISELNRKSERRYVLGYAINALGMLKDKRATVPLLEYLKSPRLARSKYGAYTKNMIYKALGSIQDPSSVKEIGENLFIESNQDTLKIGLMALQSIGDKSAVEVIDRLLTRADLSQGNREFALEVKEALLKN